MAHFAQLDNNNLVTQVVVVNNNELLDSNGQETESLGVSFCQSLFGLDTIWKQTSYNANFRKNYAGIGYTYDANRNAFIPSKPFASWVLNETTCNWDSPTPMPNDGKRYAWNEEQLAWVEVTNID